MRIEKEASSNIVIGIISVISIYFFSLSRVEKIVSYVCNKFIPLKYQYIVFYSETFKDKVNPGNNYFYSFLSFILFALFLFLFDFIYIKKYIESNNKRKFANAYLFSLFGGRFVIYPYLLNKYNNSGLAFPFFFAVFLSAILTGLLSSFNRIPDKHYRKFFKK